MLRDILVHVEGTGDGSVVDFAVKLALKNNARLTGISLRPPTQNLYELLMQRNIVLTDDKKLEEQSQNAVAIESGRGMKLAKEKSTRKIDSIVALSFACLFAVENMNYSGPASTRVLLRPEIVRLSALSFHEIEERERERLASYRRAMA